MDPLNQKIRRIHMRMRSFGGFYRLNPSESRFAAPRTRDRRGGQTKAFILKERAGAPRPLVAAAFIPPITSALR
jgi:hypothetical protein